MAEMLQGNLPPQLQFERLHPGAVGPGLLAHLDHQIAAFRPGEDQLAPHREVVVAFWERVFCRRQLRRGVLSGFEGAGFPHTHNLEVEAAGLADAGIHHPEMGAGHVQMAAHQAEHTAQHHRFNLGPLGGADQAAGGLLRISGHVLAANHANGPVLHRFGDRGNRMETHLRGGQPLARSAI